MSDQFELIQIINVRKGDRITEYESMVNAAMRMEAVEDGFIDDVGFHRVKVRVLGSQNVIELSCFKDYIAQYSPRLFRGASVPFNAQYDPRNIE